MTQPVPEATDHVKLPSQDERSEKRLVEPLSKVRSCGSVLAPADELRVSCAGAAGVPRLQPD